MNNLSTQEALQTQLDHAIKAGFPGITAAIGCKDRIIWRGQAGLSSVPNNSPVTPNHIFGIGSITKVFVSVVILQLAEAKLLDLDATLGCYLPSAVLDGIPSADSATIASCLNHTSGIPSWEDDPAWIRVGRGEDVDPEKLWGKNETLDFIRHPTEPGTWVPGQFAYSNTNFTLLGLLSERITGDTAESEIRRRILEPLGMESTFLEGFEDVPKERIAGRYHYSNSEFRSKAGISKYFPEVKPGIIDASSSNLSVEWTAGGNLSSPDDLVRFATAIRDGKLLSAESLAYMKSWESIGKPLEVGHGLFRINLEGKIGKLIFHNGSVLGYSGAIWWSEQADCVAAVLCNMGTVHAGPVLGGYSVAMGLSPAFKEFPELALPLADENHNSQF